MSTPIRPFAAAVSACRHCRHQYQRVPFLQTTRAASTTPTQIRPPARLSNITGQFEDDLANAPPRWARTPSAMKAPHSTRPKSDNDDFPCNEDPNLLDEAYVKVLGGGGDKMLPEEVKWLAVTHKSFDHGRRGFNDRLAYLGRRIIELQTSLALLTAPQSDAQLQARIAEDQHGRVPFQHPSLQNIENAAIHIKEAVLDKKRLAQLAQRYGLNEVIRWKPRQIKDLKTSGIDLVLRDTLFAIIGAIALQKGGEVAKQTVRQRILHPLGLV